VSSGSRLGKSMSIESTRDLRGLLRNFARGEKREESFRAIAGHLSGLIYHAAFRQSGDASVAEEVMQNVLVQVSRKAGKLVKHPEILAWVHEATRLEVLQMRRAQTRRTKREETAMKNMGVEQTRNPHLLVDLDESLRALNSSERELVLMRFFEGRTFPAIASETGRSETAEKKRLKKALEKMAGWFGKKGVALSVAGLTTVLSTEMGKAAPVGLALVSAASEVSAVGATTAGSGKLAGGMALLLAAGLSVPILSKWNEVKELERRVAEFGAGKPTVSSRRGGAKSSRMSVGEVIESVRREAGTPMTVDEIVAGWLRLKAVDNRLERRKLTKQLELLGMEELTEVVDKTWREGLLAFGYYTLEEEVLSELELRLESWEPLQRLEFLIPLRMTVDLARKEFGNWMKTVELGAVKTWLLENDGLLKKHALGYALQGDLRGKIWESYIQRCFHQEMAFATKELREAPLTGAQNTVFSFD